MSTDRNHGEGLYKILRQKGFWYVGRLLTADTDGTPVYQRVSNLYCFRGWAENYARRFKLNIS